jgi:hypothetical protein
MSKKDRFEITEIFMAKVGNDWNRCYHGTIRREVDENGKPVVYGKIKINNGYICAQASDQWELGAKLDELAFMVYHGLI